MATPTNRSRQSGISLIESLIAVMVLSVGMLGIARLHLESLKTSRTALLRTRAAESAGDMAERMRSNRVGALAGNYVVAANGTGANRDCAEDLAGGATVPCTPAFMADHDIWLWKQALTDNRTGLPGGATGAIVSDGAAVPTYTIEVRWIETGEDYGFGLQVQP